MRRSRLIFRLCWVLSVVIGVAGCGTSAHRSPAKSHPTAKAARTTHRSLHKDNAPPAASGPAQTAEERIESQSRYAQGVLHDLADEPDKALEEYYHSAKADPQNEELVLEVSERFLRQRETSKALDLLARAAEYPTASARILARLGTAYILAGKRELAIQANYRAIRKSPRMLGAYQNLARIHAQAGQLEEGIKVLDQAGAQQGADESFLLGLAESYIGFHRSQNATNQVLRLKALQTLDRAAALKPANPFVLARLGDDYQQVGELERAEAIYLLVLDRHPEFVPVREKLATLSVRRGDKAGAAKHFQALIEEEPTRYPQAYYFLGSLASESNRPEEAEDYFKKALSVNPNFEPAYYDLAGAQMNRGKPEDALTTLQEARSRFEQNFICELFSALAWTRMKNYTNAIEHFTSAETIARTSETNRLTPRFYFQMGAAYEGNSNRLDAATYFERALSLDPDFSEALNYLGYMWADHGENLPRARELIERALKLEPDNAAFLDSMGWVLFKLSLPNEALPWLLKAIEASKEPDSTLYEHLGDIYAALGNQARANEAWQKALTLQPTDQLKAKLAAGKNGEPSR